MRPPEVSQYDLSSDEYDYESGRTSSAQGDTDRILSYYVNHAATGNPDSEHEKNPQYLNKRKMSSATEASSSSEYSLDNFPSSAISPSTGESHEAKAPGRSERRTRKQSGLQSAGSDLIMRIIAPPSSRHNNEISSSATRQALSENGHGVGLAGTAGGSRGAYTDDVLQASMSSHRDVNKTAEETSYLRHQRSASESSGGIRGPRSRVVGIVRANQGQLANAKPRDHTPANAGGSTMQPLSEASLTPPIPKTSYESSSSPPSTMANPTNPVTDQGVDIRQSLHDLAALNVNIPSTASSNTPTAHTATTSHIEFTPSNPSSYVRYQPGIHSTAGPPPPPIQRLFVAVPSNPPPRPPRLHTPTTPLRKSDQDPTKESLVPQDRPPSRPSSKSSQNDSATTRLAEPTKDLSKEDSTTTHLAETNGKVSSREASDHGHAAEVPIPLHHSRSMHIREGAFPPSTSEPISRPTSIRSTAGNGSVVSAAPSQESKDPPITDEQQSFNEVAVDPLISDRSHDNQDPTIRPASELRRESSWVNLTLPTEAESKMKEKDTTPTSTVGRANSLKATLTSMKRFSALPRTPSLMSMSLLVNGETKMSRSPSPSLPPIPVRPKILSRWPAAMQFKNILAHQSPLDRSIGYANKINELALYDCGLGDWVTNVKNKGASRRPTSRPSSADLSYRAPSSVTDHGHPRQTSHGSTGSEVTFPTRSDAYTATDLSSRPDDVLPTATPSLPYPALAQGSRSTTRFSMLASPPAGARGLPVGNTRSGGFFASISKKTISKKDRQNQSPPPKLTKRPPVNVPPKPIELGSAPVVPGGPRALPSRSRSVVASPSPEEVVKPSQHKRRSSMVLRPSLFSSSKGATVTATPIPRSNADFNEQLDKLAILLPQADRDVLAGYLRRSGQDILAVGRYLEDEKNGTIIRS